MKKILALFFVVLLTLTSLSYAGTTIVTNQYIVSNVFSATRFGCNILPSSSNVFSIGSSSNRWLSGYFSNTVSAQYFQGNIFGVSDLINASNTSFYYGYNAGLSSTGSYNHYVGYCAGYLSKGLSNSYFGKNAGTAAITTNCTFIGSFSGRNARGRNRIYIDQHGSDPGSSYNSENGSIFIDDDNNNLYLGRRWITAHTYIRATNFYVNSIDLTPAEPFASITITNGTPSADMQTQIDSMKKFVTDNNSIFIFWKPGTYVMTNSLYFDGFWGSVSFALRLCGDSDWNHYGNCRTNQVVTLDFSNYDNHGLWFRGVDGWVVMNDLHIKVKTDNTDPGLYGKNSAIYTGWTLSGLILAGCYFEGTSTNSGALIGTYESPTYIVTYSNMFGNARYGIGVGAGAHMINGIQPNQVAPDQQLQYAYLIDGGRVWTNSYGGITGFVGVAAYPFGGNWINR